jgi:hypothetical protein
MMFAQREQLNILDNYQLIMVFVKDRPVHKVANVLLISFREEKYGFSVSLWCASQPFPFYILANAFEYGFHSAFEFD